MGRTPGGHNRPESEFDDALPLPIPRNATMVRHRSNLPFCKDQADFHAQGWRIAPRPLLLEFNQRSRPASPAEIG
jgi:hypothetical protein